MVSAVVTPERSTPHRHAFRHRKSSQRENDGESGLMRFRARSYDPRTGRFGQQDPVIDNRTTEHYVYVSNAPVTLTDPSGLGWLWTWENRFRQITINVFYSNMYTHLNPDVFTNFEKIISKALMSDSRNIGLKWNFINNPVASGFRPGGTTPLKRVATYRYNAQIRVYNEKAGALAAPGGSVAGSFSAFLYNRGIVEDLKLAVRAGFTPIKDIYVANVLVHELAFHAIGGCGEYSPAALSETRGTYDLTQYRANFEWVTALGTLPPRAMSRFLDAIDN